MSCILALYLLAAGVKNGAQSPDPEALYRQRDDKRIAAQAAEIWAARAKAGSDFDATWKFARACYWLGTQDAEAVRRDWLVRGVAAGEEAAKMRPNEPDGHFWMAANMGALAESYGLTQGIKYRGRIKSELERVLAISPAWMQGSADRAIGWWYHRVPRLFGGSEAEAEAHLRKALEYSPQSTATLYFLGEVLMDRGKIDEARTTFQRVLSAPNDPDWTPEDKDFKRKAEASLKTLAGRR